MAIYVLDPEMSVDIGPPPWDDETAITIISPAGSVDVKFGNFVAMTNGYGLERLIAVYEGGE